MSSGGGVLAAPLPAMSGYLLKKSTVGEWQRRYFETNGLFLLYYNNEKMAKLLAALSVPEVGEITYVGAVDDNKGEGHVFSLEIKSRSLHLRTSTYEEAQKWISALIELRDRMERSKEAKLLAQREAANAAASTGSTIDSNASIADPREMTLARDSSSNSGTTTAAAAAASPGRRSFRKEATAVWQKSRERCNIL